MTHTAPFISATHSNRPALLIRHHGRSDSGLPVDAKNIFPSFFFSLPLSYIWLVLFPSSTRPLCSTFVSSCRRGNSAQAEECPWVVLYVSSLCNHSTFITQPFFCPAFFSVATVRAEWQWPGGAERRLMSDQIELSRGSRQPN